MCRAMKSTARSEPRACSPMPCRTGRTHRYSASKAASDHFAGAWWRTFGLPVIVSHCSNNYGPYQMPEKLIPVTILAALEGSPAPVYGDGKNCA